MTISSMPSVKDETRQLVNTPFLKTPLQAFSASLTVTQKSIKDNKFLGVDLV